MTQLPPHLEAEQDDPDKWKSLIFAAAVHLALIGALFLGVQWKSQSPAPVAVEMWRGAPPMAVPEPPPEPRPAPPEPKPEPRPEPRPEPKPEPKPAPKPDIVVKKEEKPKKPEPPKPEPKKEEPRKPEPKEKPPEKKEPQRPSFDDELRREERQLQQQKMAQEAARDMRARADAEAQQRAQAQADFAASARNRGLADYTSKIRNKIRGNIVLPPGLQGNPQAIFEVVQLPSGEVLSVKLAKSSGNPALDAAIERAIHKSSPLPKPEQAELFERNLKIPYKPFEE